MDKMIKEFKKEPEQIETSKANGGRIEDIPDEAWMSSRWVGELKLDGTRLKMEITDEGQRFTTRRISEKSNKFMDRSNNLLHLRDLDLKELTGTILDGEGIAPVDKDVMGTTQSIIGAGPEHSWEIQERVGWLEYHVFDIIQYRGKDLREISYSERHKTLKEVVEWIKNKYPEVKLMVVPQIIKNKKEFYHKVVERGGEGIILKDLDSLYYDSKGMLKVKKSQRWTMVITGFKDGAGKHLGKVGSLGIGFYKEPQLTFAGGLSDSLRQDMKDHPEEYLGKIVEIEALEMTKTGSLRHPRVIGTSEDDRDSLNIITERMRIFRTDKKLGDCLRTQNSEVR